MGIYQLRNNFMETDLEQFSTGAFESPRDYRDVPLAAVGPEEDAVYAASMPSSYFVDVSKLPVWHQRKIGACVGHAAGKYKQLIDLKETGEVIPYSARFLYALAKARDGYAGEGTYPRIVAKILKDIGCPTETEVPNDTTLDHETYVYGRDESKVPGKDQAAAGQIGGYAFPDPQSVLSLKKAIIEFNGAMFLMRIDKAWWTKKDGTPTWFGSELVPLRAPTGDISGHEVYLYGFEDVVENGITRTKFFVFNSWSVDWGLAGRAWFYHDEYKPWLNEAITFVDLPNDLKKRISELPDAKSFKHAFNVDIKAGQRGDDVKALQTALMIDGNFSRELYAELLKEDALGYFKPGGVTQKALLDFQLEHLVPSGVSTRKDLISLNGAVCGPKTRKALNSLYS